MTFIYFSDVYTFILVALQQIQLQLQSLEQTRLTPS
jgi:hypothetical protein